MSRFFILTDASQSIQRKRELLGSVYPNTDRTVAFYLDPLICAKEGTDVNCRVSFKDAFGRPDSVQMEPLKIKVVCPIFRTDQDVNIGRLKELISELQFHDSKVYTIPKRVELSELLRTCRDVVLLHDVRHIKTFKTTDEKTYEAWYYGKTKVSKKDLVIKCSVQRDTESIEVFAAGNDPSDITGLLAEIGRNLTKEFERLGKVQPVFNIHIKDSIIQKSNLLSFCDIDGSCGGNVVIEDSVVQRSDIASWNEAAQKEREEAQKREKEEQERLRRQKEQEERAQRERKAREESERRKSERQKARQEEERLRKPREEREHIPKEREEVAGTSYKKFFAVALALGVLLLGYWALAPGSIPASENLKSTPPPTPKIAATTIQTPKATPIRRRHR
ncbi:MAG: MAP7 domain-containing protein [Candidatus Methanoperedens sp.]|nr:MAP7 domain-containing protein [Candidatus Methanoperedens sp.]